MPGIGIGKTICSDHFMVGAYKLKINHIQYDRIHDCTIHIHEYFH